MFQRMPGQDKHVIDSLMDADFYKFTMGQMIHYKHPYVPTTFAFKNRTKSVRLADSIDIGELRENLEHIRGLRFTNSELHYIGGTFEYGSRMFTEGYVNYLKGFQLSEFSLEARDGQLDLQFYGSWPEASLWETLAMSVVNELYTESQMSGMTQSQRERVFAEGMRRLDGKIRFLRQNPGIIFSDFGTRRRATKFWQDYVVGTLTEKLPPGQFRGTSNTWLAMKHSVMPMGTNAHEMPMVYSGIYYDEDEQDPLVSQRMFLEDWEQQYGLSLSIFLPDTYGSEYFFHHLVTPEQLQRWKGSREDSGDPFEYGERRIEQYQHAGIDPNSKTIVFANALYLKLIESIGSRFSGRIGHSFGWGTNLTNDIGLRPVSIIIKPARANGHPVVKLSDNIEKATGDPAEIERMKRLTGYDVQYAEECTY